MKHYIIAKWNGDCDRKALLRPVTELFEQVLAVPGVHGVQVKDCCVDRPNRFDLMIEIDMEPSALAAYDACEVHHRWKELYGPMLKAKTIFDSEA